MPTALPARPVGTTPTASTIRTPRDGRKASLPTARRAAALVLLLGVLGVLGGTAAAQGPVAPLSAAEMAAEVQTLQAMLARDPASLPRRGERAFVRLTAPIHADQWASSTAPLADRLEALGRLGSAYAGVARAYSQAMQTEDYLEEVPDLLGAGTHVQAVALQAYREAERMAAGHARRGAQFAGPLRDGRAATVAMLRTSMGMLVPSMGIGTEARLRLTDRLLDEAPALAVGLDAGSAREVANIAEDMSGRVENAALAARLGQIEALFRARARER